MDTFGPTDAAFAFDATHTVSPGHGRMPLLSNQIYYGLRMDEEHPSLPDIVAELRIAQELDGYVEDDRADWHHNTTPIQVWMKAHAYRLAMGWQSKALADWFRDNAEYAREFGFRNGDDGLARYNAKPPSQSRLWEVWNDVFPPWMQRTTEQIAKTLRNVAREEGIPVPDEVFQPDDRDGESERSERRLTEEKTKEVWREAKPLVMDTFYLDRARNARIPEGTFWESQAYVGMRQNNCIEEGVDAYRMATTCPPEQQHTGRTHRHHVQKHSVEDVRRMLRETTRRLIQRARHNGELQGNLWAAIDITKGAPWTGQVERNDDDSLAEPYILGYKDGEIYFQWATIQIVGLDIPLVLDAVPVERGMGKAEIVETLLDGALDLVPDLELVMMDREFDSRGVKDACDRHDVYYLNPARKFESEKAMCSQLREAGKKARIEEQSALTGPSRKRVYLPARNTDVFEPTDGDADEVSEEEHRQEIRQELVDDFMEIGGDTDAGDGHGFEDLIGEIRENEGVERGNDEDVDAYALFETNHPALDTDAKSEKGLLSQIRGFVKRYSHRWGIENGYKQLKQFRVRTSSKSHEYRYFCFAFACVLYNVWRLVDLLVKLAFEDDPDYAPRVTASVFLTLAGNRIGLDPPD